MTSFEGQHVVVVGGASGMGAATAATAEQLGARVTVMDVQVPPPSDRAFVPCDLRDRASTDSAADVVEGPIYALVSCAGVADGSEGIERVNLIGQVHLIDRFLGQEKLPRGAAIAMISSTAGLGWEQRLDLIDEVLGLDGWDARQRWMDEHPELKSYVFTKQAVCAFVSGRGGALLARGIRLNAVLPGPTDTPLARANADTWLTWGARYREAAGVPHLVPQQQADGLLFLCSPAASGINGTTLVIDQGLYGAMGAGVYVEQSRAAAST